MLASSTAVEVQRGISFHIHSPVQDWSDHAALSATWRLSEALVATPQRRQHRAGSALEWSDFLGLDTALDMVLTDVLHATKLTMEEKITKLYGSVYCIGDPVSVWIAESTSGRHNSAKGGAGICFGKNSSKNAGVQGGWPPDMQCGRNVCAGNGAQGR